MEDSDWVAFVDGVAEELAAIFREPLLEGNAIIERDVSDWSEFANYCVREVFRADSPSSANPGPEAGSRHQDAVFVTPQAGVDPTAVLRFSIPHFDPPNNDEGEIDNAGAGPSHRGRQSIGVGQTPRALATQSIGVGRTPGDRQSIGVGPTPMASRVHNVGVGRTPEPTRANQSVGVGQSPEFVERWGPGVETQDVGVGGGSVLTPERPRRFSEKWQVAGANKTAENATAVEGVDPPGADLPELPTDAAVKNARPRSEGAPNSDAPSAYYTPERLSIGGSPFGGEDNGGDVGPSVMNAAPPANQDDSRSPKRTCNPGGGRAAKNVDIGTPRREPISPDEELQGSPMDREELPTKKLCFNERSSASPTREGQEGPSDWSSGLAFDGKNKQPSPSRPDLDEMDTDVIFGSPKGQATSFQLSPMRDFLFPPKGQSTTSNANKETHLSSADILGVAEKENNDAAGQTRKGKEAAGDMDVDTSDFAFDQVLPPSAPMPMSPVAFIPTPSGPPGLDLSAHSSEGRKKASALFQFSHAGSDLGKSTQKGSLQRSPFFLEADDGGSAPRQREPSLSDGVPAQGSPPFPAQGSPPFPAHGVDATGRFSIDNLDASVIKKARPSRIPTPPREKPTTLQHANRGIAAEGLPTGMKTPKSPRGAPKGAPSSKRKPRPFGYKGKPQGANEDSTNTGSLVTQLHSFLKQGGKKKEESMASGKHDVKVPALQRAAAAKQKQEERAREREERKKMFRKVKTQSELREGGVKRQAETPALPTTTVKKQKRELPVGPVREGTSGTHHFKTATLKKPGSALRQGPPAGQKKEVKSFLDQNQTKGTAFGKGRLGTKGNLKTPCTSRAIPAAVGTPEYELTPPSVTEKHLPEREQRAYRKEKHIPSWAKSQMGIKNHFMGKQKKVNPDELFKTSKDRGTLDLFEVFGKPDLTVPGNIRKEQTWLKRSYSNGDWSDWQG
ncbi:hypothetical protein BSKO_10014 [Bryopsis sp. KO-2023]|nr:hypothetical protein BSKO_10014 [Bryopsis sp. KO-2023]